MGGDGARQVLNDQGNPGVEADAGRSHTDLDEEERSIGVRVAADVNPSQDDGRYQEHSQHNAHDGAQVYRRPLGLWGQVVLKSYGGQRKISWSKEKLGLPALCSDKVPEMSTHIFQPTEGCGWSWQDDYNNMNVLAP